MRIVKNIRKRRPVSLSEAEGGIWLALLSSVVLGGCSTMYGPTAGTGGASDVSESKSGATATVPEAAVPPIQGRAINGYLVNALVFQDTNNDGLLSANENLALTDTMGRFSLPGTSSGDLIVKPVNMLSDVEKNGAQERLRAIGVVNPDVLTTYYQTSADVRVDFKGQLEVPSTMVAGAVNVTPLTTLVNGLIHSGQLDAISANQKVEQLFGMAPGTDYVALAASGSVADAKAGVSLQNKAVALSNLLTGTFQLYDDSLSKMDLLELLAIKVLTRLEEASANPLADLDVAAYLASSSDIRSILLEIGNQSDLEINLNKLGTAVDSMVALNSLLVAGNVVRLTQDTGLSGVDHVTSDGRFSLPDSGSTQSYVYGVTNRFVGADDSWLPDTWYATADALSLSQGMNTVFLKPKEGGVEDVLRLSLNFDNLRPQLNTMDGGQPIEIFQSPHFQPDEVNYVSNIEVANTFFVNQDFEGAKLFTQFQLVRSNPVEVMAQANPNAWLQFPNISEGDAVNGIDMRLYYRQIDLAGNFSDAGHFDFVYDNEAPVALFYEDVSLTLDTGIYGYDKYTTSLALNPLNVHYSNAHDESTVAALGQWIRVDDAIDPLKYVINPVKPLVDGEYTFVAYQADRAGNISETLRIDHVLDTLAPDVILVSGFKDLQGHVLPLLDYDRSDDSLTEWVQYRMVDISGSVAQRSASEWMNISTVHKSGSYDVYYRSMDRAGNASQELYAGQVNIDLDAPVLKFDHGDALEAVSSSGLLGWIKGHVLVDGEALIPSRLATYQTPAASGLTLMDYFVTAWDVSGNVSSPWSMSSLQNDVQRFTLRSASDAGFLMQAQQNEATDFVLDAASDSLIALGSAMSDRAVALNVGDIFLGMGGGDLTLVDSSVYVSGLSFLNQAETQFFVDTFEDFLTDEQLQELRLSPILKAYLENEDDPEAGGIAIFQSQFARYGTTSSAEYLSTKWNPSLGLWFVDLGANDDVMYFGGDAMNIYGGAGSDLLQGGSGNDYLVAGSNSAGGTDILRGYAGDDTLVGGDYLFHSNVSVVLEGGSGNDTLVVGNGRSQLKGDAGTDLFVIAPMEDSSAPIVVEILDFLPGTDFLLFNGFSRDAVMKGIFVDHEAGSVVVDLTNLMGTDSAPFGSTLTMTGLAVEGLLPEDIAAGWFDLSAEASFEWSDLAIDTLVWS